MKKITVNTGQSYDILIQTGIFEKIDELVKQIYSSNHVFVITDKCVSGLYLDKLKANLKSFIVDVCIIDGKEQDKNIDVYMRLVHELIGKGIRRNHLLISLGGGVVGDLTGFIAGTLYRGIDYIQIPTTLLAQTDSSIGGKTGIDLPEGKNLLGVFYQPRMVIIDPLVLNTLPHREWSIGTAELIKHGLIGDARIITRLEKNMIIDEDILYDSICVKKAFVEADELDKGKRMILNFGHTFGHAIEKKYGYERFTHGEAISIGMLMAIRLGIYLKLSTEALYSRVETLLKKADLPVECFAVDEYIDLIKTDKKNLAGVLNFVLLQDVGVPCLYPLAEQQLGGVLDECQNKTK